VLPRCRRGDEFVHGGREVLADLRAELRGDGCGGRAADQQLMGDAGAAARERGQRVAISEDQAVEFGLVGVRLTSTTSTMVEVRASRIPAGVTESSVPTATGPLIT
jgi:hypothetical protein